MAAAQRHDLPGVSLDRIDKDAVGSRGGMSDW